VEVAEEFAGTALINSPYIRSAGTPELGGGGGLRAYIVKKPFTELIYLQESPFLLLISLELAVECTARVRRTTCHVLFLPAAGR